jgi:hypothetical protein
VGVSTPERTPVLLAAAIGAAELDVAAGYFARDACLVTPGATARRFEEEWKLAIAMPWS